MGILFNNNAVSTLASSIGAATTELSLTTGDGALFPSAGGANYFIATLFNEAGDVEVIKVTQRVGDVLTVVRAQEGTAAQSWPSSTTRIEMRVTAGSLEALRDAADAAQADATQALSDAATAQSAADNAQTAADNAQTAANNAQGSADDANAAVAAVSAGWLVRADTIISSTGSTIVLSGDKTADYLAGRAIRVNDSDVQQGWVLSSSYSAPNTTVTVSGFTVSSPTSIRLGLIPKKSVLPFDVIPTGAVLPFAMNTAPANWLECDGSAVSRTTYAQLFAAIGVTFGVGDGSTTFNLPDLRGEFVRGWDHSRGVDSGRAFGSAQGEEFKSHTHTVRMDGDVNGVVAWGNTKAVSTSAGNLPANAGTAQIDATGGSETRPRNVALMYCIKT